MQGVDNSFSARCVHSSESGGELAHYGRGQPPTRWSEPERARLPGDYDVAAEGPVHAERVLSTDSPTVVEGTVQVNVHVVASPTP